MKKVEIELISDFICPWCYIGKVRLERVAENIRNEIELDIRLRPFLLYPAIPAEGSAKSHFAKKTKPGMGKSLRYEAAEEDIQINYKRIDIIPSSREAHRMVALIKDSKLQFQFAKFVFEAYFQRGLNIGKKELLSDLARESGVSKNVLSIFLNSDEGVKEVERQINLNEEEFIGTVPVVLLGRGIIVSWIAVD